MRLDPSTPPVVLAVDDDPAVRDAFGAALEDDCDVCFATDGLEALATLASRSIDVVLLDLLLPRMNGHAVLARIRTTHIRIPVIVVSAVVDVSSVVASMKLGAWGYVTKPWRDDELLTKVHGAAHERRQEPGVLLVSDDVASLAPLQLALEPGARVLATTVARAASSGFPAKVIVLKSRAACVVDDARVLHRHFPEAALVIIGNGNGAQVSNRLQGLPVAAVATSDRLDSALPELLRLGVVHEITLPHPAVAAAVGFIAVHYGDRISVADVAQAACLSQDRLAHVFPEGTGSSVKDYVTRLRVTIARRLLVETTATVEAISTRVGFADVSNFSRNFKQVDGLPPGEFRRSQSTPARGLW